MAPRRKTKTLINRPGTGRDLAGYGDLIGGIADMLESARRASARAVNAFVTTTYWEISRRVVEHEQRGKERADYRDALIERLSIDPSTRFTRGPSLEGRRLRRSAVAPDDGSSAIQASPVDSRSAIKKDETLSPAHQ